MIDVGLIVRACESQQRRIEMEQNMSLAEKLTDSVVADLLETKLIEPGWDAYVVQTRLREVISKALANNATLALLESIQEREREQLKREILGR